MKEEIIELLEKYQKLSPKELQEKLGVKSGRAIKEMVLALNELEDDRQIYNDHSKYMYLNDRDWMVGKVRDISMDQYAVINKDRKVYVDKHDHRIFLDKDEVLVKLGRNNEIVHVYDRGIEYITGTFIRTRRGMKFRSDVDLHTTFDVENIRDFTIANNTKAVVKVVKYTTPLVVKIVKLLGKEGEKGVDIAAILYENNVRQKFGKKVEKEVAGLPDHVRKKEIKDRVDLRKLPTITIDGDTTKDFDDAISVEKTPEGWRLWVHIADVSHYVEEGDEIDEEAYKRGTSIYIADRVIPMLPVELSNGICSLNPDVDRLTLSVCMDFDFSGNMTNYEIMETVIHSDMRTTYSKVNEYLKDEKSVPEYRRIGAMLKDFSDLAKILKENTSKRGHIDFETKEPYFVLDEKTGKPTEIIVKDRGWAEQMIEEAMIAANVAVAHDLHSKKLPGMFRVHEIPDPERIESLISFAKALHVPCHLDPHNCKPIDIAEFLNSVEDKETKALLSTMAVRSMQKARYAEENLGHYGLALEEYCHFTSPIRRYPDLLIHRMLRKHVIKKKNDEKSIKKDEKKMEKSANHLSEKERDAIFLERAVNDLKSAEYMEDKIGQEFDAVISGVASFGFFVELDNTIEGLVPMRTMKDDYYRFDQDTMTLTGENTGKKYVMGQPVRVKLKDVNVPKRQITFDVLNVPEKKDDVIEAEVTETDVKPEAAIQDGPAKKPQPRHCADESSQKDEKKPAEPKADEAIAEPAAESAAQADVKIAQPELSAA